MHEAHVCLLADEWCHLQVIRPSLVHGVRPSFIVDLEELLNGIGDDALEE